MIVNNNAGLTIGRLQGASVELTARVPQAKRAGTMLGEPVLVCGRLFLRQLEADSRTGLLPALGRGGNLVCFDLQSAW